MRNGAPLGLLLPIPHPIFLLYSMVDPGFINHELVVHVEADHKRASRMQLLHHVLFGGGAVAAADVVVVVYEDLLWAGV